MKVAAEQQPLIFNTSFLAIYELPASEITKVDFIERVLDVDLFHLDEHRTMQLISPRKVEHWAKTYKDRAAKLIEEGKMQEAGFQSIELSKQNGLWDFMDDVNKLIVPEDLQEALDKKPEATEFFYAINYSSKRFVLRWIKLAKAEKTRMARIDQIAELSAKGEKLKGS
ncbi:YdeI/OmpD-associated family protein [Arthrospiribacter ruber]|nr:YdeI/OmpD-associated family protein [Arthrospiribacter ruber]